MNPKGAIASRYEIFLDIPDTPGIIGKVASLLGEQNINIRNMGILESREDYNGQLFIRFDELSQMDAAKETLLRFNYKVIKVIDG